ncbi:unnamed protein product, partial [marine sediment metagenome]
MTTNYDIMLYAGGDDSRILELPAILDLPADPNHEPHEQKDAFGNQIKACGVRIASGLASASEAHRYLDVWLDQKNDVLQSFDVPYKWIRVLSCAQG